jgi:hypothetical protein
VLCSWESPFANCLSGAPGGDYLSRAIVDCRGAPTADTAFMGLTSCRWITIAGTLAPRRRGARPASCRLPCRCRTAGRCTLICDEPLSLIPHQAFPAYCERTIRAGHGADRKRNRLGPARFIRSQLDRWDWAALLSRFDCESMPSSSLRHRHSLFAPQAPACRDRPWRRAHVGLVAVWSASSPRPAEAVARRVRASRYRLPLRFATALDLGAVFSGPADRCGQRPGRGHRRGGQRPAQTPRSG